MLRDALEYIVGLAKPTVQKIGNETYSDKKLNRISCIHLAKEIRMTTLTSLVDYIKSNVDQMREKMIIHVVSPTEVQMFSMLGEEREREQIAEVIAVVPDFRFGCFQDHEAFCINLQSKFIDSADRALLLKFAGTVESGTVAEYGDDGVTQKATVKTGIASKSDAIVPNPVYLQPYRTFPEVDQPISQFIFRMKDNNGISCALFEADGGAWKIEAMRHIKSYLEANLADCPAYMVIS